MDDSEKQRLHEELFERAGRNEITGEAAEAEAERLGLGRLSRVPIVAEYDPQKERFRTLPMAIAWIAYGNFDAVREQWAEYRAQCFTWQWRKFHAGPGGPVREGANAA